MPSEDGHPQKKKDNKTPLIHFTNHTRGPNKREKRKEEEEKREKGGGGFFLQNGTLFLVGVLNGSGPMFLPPFIDFSH